MHADRLRAAGERRLRWLPGDAVRAIFSQETTAAGSIESKVRDGALRIARAANAAACAGHRFGFCAGRSAALEVGKPFPVNPQKFFDASRFLA